MKRHKGHKKVQLKMKGFLSQQQQKHTGKRANQHHIDPLLHDLWNKKKQRKDKDKQKEI